MNKDISQDYTQQFESLAFIQAYSYVHINFVRETEA